MFEISGADLNAGREGGLERQGTGGERVGSKGKKEEVLQADASMQRQKYSARSWTFSLLVSHVALSQLPSSESE